MTQIIETEEQGQATMKYVAVAALITLFLLAIGGGVFYRPRIFSDTAFIAFSVINDQHFHIISERFGAALTQWVPLAGSWLGLPLKAILIAYSASFHVVYFVVAVILCFRFRRYDLVVLLAFYHTIVVSGTYFFPTSEMHQGVAIVFLAIAIQQFATAGVQLPLWKRAAWHLLCSGLTFVAVFSHPLVVLSFTFLLVFYFILGTRYRRIGAIAQLLLVISFAALRWYRSSAIAYDNGQLNKVFGAAPGELFHAFANGFADCFWHGIVENYWLLPIMFIATLAVLLRQGRYRMALFIVFANVGFFILTSLAFYTLNFHVETELMPFGIFAGAGFVCFVLPLFTTPRLAVVTVTAMLLIRMGYILAALPYFERRYDAVQAVLHKMEQENISKLALLCDEDPIESAAVMYWGFPYESMLWSSMDGRQHSRTFLGIPPQIFQQTSAENLRGSMLCPWHLHVPADRLNSRYFSLDTTRLYSTCPCDEALNIIRGQQ